MTGAEVSTYHKMRHKTVSCPVDQVTLAGYADSGQNVVTCTHNCANRGLIQLIYDSSRRGFELVFENDEADKL